MDGSGCRRFQLHRDLDVSGVSGEGVVADGVEFVMPIRVEFADGYVVDLPSGWCRLVWRGQYSSIVLWPSVDDAVAVHGHGGATRVVWLDEP